MEMNLISELLEKNVERGMKFYEVLLNKSEERLAATVDEVIRWSNDGHRDKLDNAIANALKEIFSGEEFTIGDDDASIKAMNVMNLILTITVCRTILDDANGANPKFDFRDELGNNLLDVMINKCLLHML